MIQSESYQRGRILGKFVHGEHSQPSSSQVIFYFTAKYRGWKALCVSMS